MPTNHQKKIKNNSLGSFLKASLVITLLSLLSFTLQASDATRTGPNRVVSPLQKESYNSHCSDSEKEEREKLYQTCSKRFGDFGIQDIITESDIVDRTSCSNAESFVQVLAGCASYILEFPQSLNSLARYLADSELRMQATTKCSVESSSNNPRVRSRDIASCVTKEMRKLQAQIKREESNLETQMNEIQNKCKSPLEKFIKNNFSARQISRRRHLQNARYLSAKNDCYLEIAAALDCSACIDQINTNIKANLSPDLLEGIYDDFKKIGSFNCYNKKAQGKMICEMLGKGGILSGGLTLARKLGTRAAKQLAGRARTKAIQRIRKQLLENDTREGRAELARLILGRDKPLSDQEANAIWQAHLVGRGEVGQDGTAAGIGNYTAAQIREKGRHLQGAKSLSKEERRLLFKEEVVGDTTAPRTLATRDQLLARRDASDQASQVIQSRTDQQVFSDAIVSQHDAIIGSISGGRPPISRAVLMKSLEEYASMARLSKREFSPGELPSLTISGAASPSTWTARSFVSAHLMDAARKLRRNPEVPMTQSERNAIMQRLHSEMEAMGLGNDFLKRTENLRLANANIPVVQGGMTGAPRPPAAILIDAYERKVLLNVKKDMPEFKSEIDAINEQIQRVDAVINRIEATLPQE